MERFDALALLLLLLLLLAQVCEEPNAMAVASCSSMGQPSLRYVLLKGEASSSSSSSTAVCAVRPQSALPVSGKPLRLSWPQLQCRSSNNALCQNVLLLLALPAPTPLCLVHLLLQAMTRAALCFTPTTTCSGTCIT
jgi:hypothetical protein